MIYSFHPEAQSEFRQATLYYFEKSPSLASAFYSEIESTIEKIDRLHFYTVKLMKTSVVA
jgi:plasmid stabilization system protein ParE